MLREMQKRFLRLLLIPSPPSSFNQTVNHLSVSSGFIAVTNYRSEVQDLKNKVQERLPLTVKVYRGAVLFFFEG